MLRRNTVSWVELGSGLKHGYYIQRALQIAFYNHYSTKFRSQLEKKKKSNICFVYKITSGLIVPQPQDKMFFFKRMCLYSLYLEGFKHGTQRSTGALSVFDWSKYHCHMF